MIRKLKFGGYRLYSRKANPKTGKRPLYVAFAVTAPQLAEWEAQLERCKVAIEGRTSWPRGGRSVYFRDPDGASARTRHARRVEDLLTKMAPGVRAPARNLAGLLKVCLLEAAANGGAVRCTV
jgi:hypothetical protein